MKGHKPIRTPDSRKSRAFYERITQKPEAVHVMRDTASGVFYVSRWEMDELVKRSVVPDPKVFPPPMLGNPVEVVGWLPQYRTTTRRVRRAERWRRIREKRELKKRDEEFKENCVLIDRLTRPNRVNWQTGFSVYNPFNFVSPA